MVIEAFSLSLPNLRVQHFITNDFVLPGGTWAFIMNWCILMHRCKSASFRDACMRVDYYITERVDLLN